MTLPPEPAPPSGEPSASGWWARLVGVRGRNVLKTGAWSLVARACGAANLFVGVPFVLDALGTARFGVWATLCTFTALAGFLDFGFGNGAMNLMASARGRDASDEYPLIVAGALRAVLSVMVWVSGVAAAMWWVMPWGRILGLGEDLTAEASQAVGIVLVATLLTIPLALANRLQLGMGRGDRAFRWQSLASLLTLGAVVVFAVNGASLPALTAAAVGIPLLGLLMNTLELRRAFGAPDPMLARVRLPGLVREMRRSGFSFFLLQMGATLAFVLDLPLLTALAGPSDAATFAIVQRLFSVVSMGLAMVWVPLWPTYRDALAAGDHAWVTRTFRCSVLAATGLAAVAGACLALGFELATMLWLGRSVPASMLLLAGFATWCVADAAGAAVATFLNAAEIMRPQMIVAAAFVVLGLPMKAWAASTHGADGIIWVSAGLCMVVNLFPLFMFRHRIVTAVWNRIH